MKEVRGPTQDTLCVINIDPVIVNNEPIPSNTLDIILLFTVDALSFPHDSDYLIFKVLAAIKSGNNLS
jgi:hypothetical protein